MFNIFNILYNLNIININSNEFNIHSCASSGGGSSSSLSLSGSSAGSTSSTGNAWGLFTLGKTFHGWLGSLNVGVIVRHCVFSSSAVVTTMTFSTWIILDEFSGISSGNLNVRVVVRHVVFSGSAVVSS